MSRKRDAVEETFRRWVKLDTAGRNELSNMAAIHERFEGMPDEEKEREALRLRVAHIAASAERIRKPQAVSVPKRGRPPGRKNKPDSEGGGPVEPQVA